MAAPLVSDAFWSLFAPLLPSRPPRPKGGRPPVGDRAALAGVLFLPKGGIPSGDAPARGGLRLRHDVPAAAVPPAVNRRLAGVRPRAPRPGRPEPVPVGGTS